MVDAGSPQRRLPVLDEGREDGERGFRERVRTKSERVHVLTGTVCNNNCIFCMEEDRDGRKVTNARTDDDLVEWILREHAGCEEICFTSGEPTTNRRLPHWVKMAKAAGVPKISIMTNGRALGYERFAKGLAKAGLNRFYISIHGHTEKLHDSLVRTPGAYDQTVAGIRQIAALQRYGIELHTSTVITKRNLPHVGEIYAFLRGLGVQQVILNVMQANGRANTHFERIFPRYSEIAETVRAFLEASEEERPMAFLVDIPPCTTTALPDFNRGFVESYKHYEGPSDTSHDIALEGEDVQGPGGASVSGIRRSDLDDAMREKRAECSSCKYDSVCEGVWRNYLTRYGWDEMQPVLAAEG
ncbi:MAG: MoaA/NifB/PqqE/SkfB family radical SAM enzyme [Polyangiales bacterium]